MTSNISDSLDSRHVRKVGILNREPKRKKKDPKKINVAWVLVALSGFDPEPSGL